MVSKKSTKKIDTFRNSLKQLKQWGFIDWDLRRKLDPIQIDYADELYKEYKYILNRPEKYVKRRVSQKTRDIWEQHGYATNNKYLILPTNGYTSIHVSSEQIIRKREDIDQGTGEVMVKREKIYPDVGIDLYNKIMHTFSLPLETGERVTLKIGKNAPFSQSYDSAEKLLNYVTNWIPKDKDVDKADLIAQMSTVRVFVKPK